MSVLPTTPYQYEAGLARVIDGDTVVLDVRLGFFITAQITFRLLGINAPELVGASHDAGIASRDALAAKLASGAITVVSHKYDKYAPRWLGEIYVLDANGSRINVNEWMVASGFAVPYTP